MTGFGPTCSLSCNIPSSASNPCGIPTPAVQSTPAPAYPLNATLAAHVRSYLQSQGWGPKMACYATTYFNGSNAIGFLMSNYPMSSDVQDSNISSVTYMNQHLFSMLSGYHATGRPAPNPSALQAAYQADGSCQYSGMLCPNYEAELRRQGLIP
jgi:hypothetical protein